MIPCIEEQERESCMLLQGCQPFLGNYYVYIYFTHHSLLLHMYATQNVFRYISFKMNNSGTNGLTSGYIAKQFIADDQNARSI